VEAFRPMPWPRCRRRKWRPAPPLTAQANMSLRATVDLEFEYVPTSYPRCLLPGADRGLAP
jgi:hypothetical protein